MDLNKNTVILFYLFKCENIFYPANVIKIQCFVEMAMIRHHAGRWIGRYRLYFIIGFIILVVQIYLAYKSLMIQPYSDSNIISQERQRIKLLEDKNKNHEALVDDEDVQSNSNSIHTLSKQRYEVIKNNNPIINKTILRLDDLDFIPICEIQSREAISAIHRAKTQKCKRHIANITCLIQENRFYPLSLPNYCPNEGLEANRALGCFKDEKNYRLLSGYYANYKTTNSPKYCSQMCLQSGFPYSGVQYSTECFCGITPPPSTMKQPDSSCNMKCPGEPKEICGGYFKMNIYETGIAKFSAQTAKTSPKENEQNVRIAYLLTLNGRAVRQVQRLIKALFHVDHYFYIHVDSRQDYLFRQLLPLENRFPNIRLSRNRFSTIWGGASLLQMLLVSMSELLKSDWKWDFVINLSESDFPIKTNEKLIQFLTANKNMNFVKSHGREVQRFIQKQGLDKTFIECDTHMWRTGDRTLPSGIQIDGGSDWITLTREFVAYVTQNNDELIEGLLKVFKHTLLPAESFFHTVLRNSRFCKTYIDNNLHVTNWKRRLGCKCQYKHVVDWCGCSPNDFKIDDWPRLQATEGRQLFFARKFEPVVDQRIILKLEEWLFKTDVRAMNAQSYWQSVYHYADISPAIDDALTSISKSLARINSDKFSDCKINVGKILEVTSHHVDDKYKGHIIQYEIDIKSHGRARMEILVNIEDHTDIDKNSHLYNYLLNVFVSSDYDQKEQISRNFGRFIGPYSDIVVIYEYIPDTDVFGSKNMTLIFIDPSGTIADISEAHIDIGRTIHFVKVPLKEPHLPGIWTIKLIHNKQYVGTTKFLITPLETYFGEEINEHHLDFVHVGSNHFYKSTVLSADLMTFFPSKLEKETLYKSAVKNSKKMQADLRIWIDSLVSTFYGILGQCIIISKNDKLKDLKCSNLNIASCDSTTWSTLVPDPKSVIGKIDLSTGMFVRT